MCSTWTNFLRVVYCHELGVISWLGSCMLMDMVSEVCHYYFGKAGGDTQTDLKSFSEGVWAAGNCILTSWCQWWESCENMSLILNKMTLWSWESFNSKCRLWVMCSVALLTLIHIHRQRKEQIDTIFQQKNSKYIYIFFPCRFCLSLCLNSFKVYTSYLI